MPFDGVGYAASNQSLQKIDAVIDLLATPDKWCKGALRSHDGRYCIRGAVRVVDGADLLEPAILQAIGEVAGRRFRRIESFNDHPNTSHDQVVAVLARARDRIAAGQVELGGPHGMGLAAPPPEQSRLAAWRGTLLGWFAG
jgi:hypothetical protein